MHHLNLKRKRGSQASKVGNALHGYDATLKAIDASLARFKLGIIDHHPWEPEILTLTYLPYVLQDTLICT